MNPRFFCGFVALFVVDLPDAVEVPGIIPCAFLDGFAAGEIGGEDPLPLPFGIECEAGVGCAVGKFLGLLR